MVMKIHGKAMDFSEVSSLLWREREALELLHYRLVTEQLLLAAGQVQWLLHADHEVEMVLGALRSTEVLRALAVDALADELGLPAGPTLVELSAQAPEPWATVLADHRHSLIEQLGLIDSVKNQNRAMLVSGSRAVRECITNTLDPLDTYDARGNATVGLRRSFLMDEQA